MTAPITLTIDEQTVTAGQGQTLLDVMRQHGLAMPVLCDFPGLSTVAACRLCLVEIASRPKLAAACATSVEEGMIVATSTERLRRYRRTTVELLLAERNHVCSVCVVNGNCELQDLAVANGIDHVRVEYQFPRGLMIDASHALFAVDHNRCVLCTRCVRICDEIEGAHTWDVAGRGGAARVITDLAMPWGDSPTCTSCGKCVQACPTGALFQKGVTVAEMVKHKEKLAFVIDARQTGQWRLDLVDGGPARAPSEARSHGPDRGGTS
ncbi:MAG TPA: bidirectional hydrogenase complex protein HoxU [Chloroflexota bacterium]|nr:bidirectional hydrogenase complex protein HoxU [Chloroflexota bacterium]